ncbi:hypothetical protein BVY03_01245, partial [bacterium K02(2017)]
YITFAFLSLMFISTGVMAQKVEGPVIPKDDLISKSKVNKKIDLPYKPNQIALDADGTIDSAEDQNNISVKKVEIDWTQVPFVPAKFPKLKPAPDPVLNQ